MKQKKGSYDISKVRVVVQSASEDLTLGVDESYTLFVLRKDGKAIVGEATIEAKQWSYIVLIKQGAEKQLNINHYNEYIQLLVGLDYVFGEKQLTNRWSILYSQNWNYIFDHTAPDNTKYFDV
uniref:uncharacterized protein LOC101296409 n=1 Tax=Fragaria vesca subsp. vesca TaxID=101020 RepID=UPI0005CB2905|nr:PREDICTED: uncharacterized protein LOC101296409 [Fragaria vesca subsp. vesca]